MAADKLLGISEAQYRVWEFARPASPVLRELGAAHGLVLGTDIISHEDSPPYDKVLVDGFAVRSADVRGGSPEREVVELVTAGQVPTREVTAGTAIRVMTGAPVPDGADAIVMAEHVTRLEDRDGRERIRLDDEPVAAGQHILPRGAVIRRGTAVFAAGRRLSAVDIGVLAEIGAHQVHVVPRPSVAVLTTGNELISATDRLGPGQIRNSNGPMLKALLESSAGSVLDLGVGPDELLPLRRCVERGLACDVLLITGGVSVGVLDLVPQVLAATGVETIFHKVNLKPGKPLWFGVNRVGARPGLVFGLPGNPVSTLVCFELFVRPALSRLSGLPNPDPRYERCTLARDHHHRGGRVTYVPARRYEEGGSVHVEPLEWKGSADLLALTGANCLLRLPDSNLHLPAGTPMEVLVP
jgi:molybdopterin molybdotransferase